jgi:hypothetical protein
VGPGAHLVDDDVIRGEQPLRLLDRPPQDCARVVERGDLGCDVGKRALRLDALREPLVGVLGGVVQAGIGQHDRGVAGERGEQLRILAIEGALSGRGHRQAANRSVIAGERCGQHRSDRL